MYKFEYKPVSRRMRIIRRRRIDSCIHKWHGGGYMTDYGYEYATPTCVNCGIDYSYNGYPEKYAPIKVMTRRSYKKYLKSLKPIAEL